MTIPHCQSPLDLSLLADYWIEDLAPMEEEAVEEHLLGCESCSRELQSIVKLTESIRDLTRKGLLRVIVSDPFVEKLRSDGLNIRQYTVQPGGSVACTITDKDDVMIAHLAADLAGAQRVDIARYDGEGHEQMRIRDIPITSAQRGVMWSEPTDFLRTLTDSVMNVRLIAVDDTRERVLGEYSFHHTASTPGLTGD